MEGDEKSPISKYSINNDRRKPPVRKTWWKSSTFSLHWSSKWNERTLLKVKLNQKYEFLKAFLSDQSQCVKYSYIHTYTTCDVINMTSSWRHLGKDDRDYHTMRGTNVQFSTKSSVWKWFWNMPWIISKIENSSKNTYYRLFIHNMFSWMVNLCWTNANESHFVSVSIFQKNVKLSSKSERRQA